MELSEIKLNLDALENIKVFKSKRKTFSIIIDKNTAVISVRAPLYATQSDIDFVLNKKKNWILHNLEIIEKRTAAFKPKVFIENEAFSIIGKNYFLKFSDDNFSGIRTEGNLLIIKKGLEKHAKSLITEVYRTATLRYAEKYIPIYVNHLKKELNISFPAINRIRISNAKTKWGSCSSQRVLSFSWRIGMAPVGVINYIICHEVAHLIHMNHSAKYWALVKYMMPDYLEQEKWLKHNGYTLEL